MPVMRHCRTAESDVGSGQTPVVGMQAVEHICRLGIGVRLTQSAVTELGHTALFPQHDESQHRDGNYRRGRDCRGQDAAADRKAGPIRYLFLRHSHNFTPYLTPPRIK